MYVDACSNDCDHTWKHFRNRKEWLLVILYNLYKNSNNQINLMYPQNDFFSILNINWHHVPRWVLFKLNYIHVFIISLTIHRCSMLQFEFYHFLWIAMVWHNCNSFFRFKEKSINWSSSRLKEDSTWFGWCELRIRFGSWISSNNRNGRRFSNWIRKRINQETTSQNHQCQR